MKNFTLILSLLISSIFLGQNTFSESVEVLDYTDNDIMTDHARIIVTAKDSYYRHDLKGTLKVWNENITYEIPLQTFNTEKEFLVKSGRYHVEARLSDKFHTIVETDFIVNSKDIKVLKFSFKIKVKPAKDLMPVPIEEDYFYVVKSISTAYSPIVSSEYFGKEVHIDSCLLKLTFIDQTDAEEVDSMLIKATYFDNYGSEKTVIETLTKNGSVNLLVEKTPLLRIEFSKSCTPYRTQQVETSFKNSGSIRDITLDITAPTRMKPSQTISPTHHNVKKPVIYAYSEKDLAVNFVLKTEASLTFTYPKYDQKWNTKVLASGGFEVNNKQYPYLFWEGEMNLSKHIEQPKVGAIVAKDSVISFLEASLSQIGLNPTEKTDFITFWAPQMMKANNYYIKFILDEDYNTAIGSLECSVTPDSEIRVFMIYSPNPDFVDVQAQTFRNHTRTGFTVVEWGGSEVLPTIFSQD